MCKYIRLSSQVTIVSSFLLAQVIYAQSEHETRAIVWNDPNVKYSTQPWGEKVLYLNPLHAIKRAEIPEHNGFGCDFFLLAKLMHKEEYIPPRNEFMEHVLFMKNHFLSLEFVLRERLFEKSMLPDVGTKPVIGEDGMLVRYALSGYVFHLEDTAYGFVSAVKPLAPGRRDQPMNRVAYVRKVASAILAPEIGLGDLETKVKVMHDSVDVTVGNWTMSHFVAWNLEALGGDSPPRLLCTNPRYYGFTARNAYFYTNGEWVAFVFDKLLVPTAALRPWRTRFDQRLLLTKQNVAQHKKEVSYAEEAHAKYVGHLKSRCPEELHPFVEPLALDIPRLPDPYEPGDFEGMTADDIAEEKAWYAEELARVQKERAEIAGKQVEALRQLGKAGATARPLGKEILNLAFNSSLPEVRSAAADAIRSIYSLPRYSEWVGTLPKLTRFELARLNSQLKTAHSILGKNPDDPGGAVWDLVTGQFAPHGLNMATMPVPGQKMTPWIMERLRDKKEYPLIKECLCRVLTYVNKKVVVQVREDDFDVTKQVTIAHPAIVDELMRITHGILGKGTREAIIDINEDDDALIYCLHDTAKNILQIK